MEEENKQEDHKEDHKEEIKQEDSKEPIDLEPGAQKKLEPEEPKPEEPKKSNFNSTKLILGLAVILVIVVVLNIGLTANITGDVAKKVKEKEEAAKPAQIQLTVITDINCEDCLDVTPLITDIPNSEITEQKDLDFTSKEAQTLIEEHSIEKLPTVIITGDIDKLSLQQFEQKEEALILSDVPAPYTDTATGKISGLVIATKIIDSSCTACVDVNIMTQQLQLGGVIYGDDIILEPKSPEAITLMEKYNIETLPALILSEDIAQYEFITQLWAQVGSIETDGSHIVRNLNPPYINVSTGEVIGLVSAIFLDDASCTTCYDVQEHKEILENPQGLGITLTEEKTVDIDSAEGKELIAKYNINLVPTVIISPQISDYPASQAIGQFFNIADDGSYIFTFMDVMGTHKDLTTDNIIEAQIPDPTQTVS